MSAKFQKSIIVVAISELALMSKRYYQTAKLKIFTALNGQDVSVTRVIESYMFECVTLEHKYVMYTRIASAFDHKDIVADPNDEMTAHEVKDVIQKHLWHYITENALSSRSSHSTCAITNVATGMKADIEAQLFHKESMGSFEGEFRDVAERLKRDQQVTS